MNSMDRLTVLRADRQRKTDGLTEITGGLTDADGQADWRTGEGQTGDADGRPSEREQWQREQDRERVGEEEADSAGRQRKRER